MPRGIRCPYWINVNIQGKKKYNTITVAGITVINVKIMLDQTGTGKQCEKCEGLCSRLGQLE